MPHLTIDYSGNLTDAGHFPELCKKLVVCLLAQRADGKPVYPVGGVRVRALAADAWSIGDGSAGLGYVHASLKVGAGRGPDTLRATGDAVFATMKAHFAALYDSMGLALSLEIGEFSEAGTWKHNNLHARLKKD